MTWPIPLADRIARLPQAPVSSLDKNAHLVLVLSLMVAYLLRRGLLETTLPRIPCLGFAKLDARMRKSFINSIMHLLVRLAAFLSVIPAFIMILAGKARFDDAFTPGGLTFGTMLMASMIIMCAVYIHEIIYREHISMVTLAHHIGTVLVGMYCIYFSMQWEHEECTQAYFAICCIFGFFDILTEFWVTTSFVICTIYRDNHRVRYLSCAWAAGLQALGSFIELPFIFILFYSGSLKAIWPTSFEVITPITYGLFLVAQGFCAAQLLKMAMKHRKAWLEEVESSRLASKV